MIFDCNLNLESFHWIVDCEEQQITSLMFICYMWCFHFHLWHFLCNLLVGMFSFFFCGFLCSDAFSVIRSVFFVSRDILFISCLSLFQVHFLTLTWVPMAIRLMWKVTQDTVPMPEYVLTKCLFFFGGLIHHDALLIPEVQENMIF